MRDRDFAELIAVLVGDYQLVSRFICFVLFVGARDLFGKEKGKGGGE